MTEAVRRGDHDAPASDGGVSAVEQLLAALLVVFLLVGGLWVYSQLDGVTDRPDPTLYDQREGVPEAYGEVARLEQTLIERQESFAALELASQQARTEYEVRREEYRTSLEEGRDDPVLRDAHDKALAAFETARARAESARALVTEAGSELAAARSDLDGRLGRSARAYDGAVRRYEAITAGIRLAYLLLVFAAALWSWRALQARGSRWAVVGMAWLVAASLQMAAMAGDYAWHHLSRYAPAVISVVGVAGTVAAIVVTQRLLRAPRRLGRRRLRRGECPYCGHPLAQAASHCAGCGRRVLLPCTHCGGAHPAFSAYCPETGGELVLTGAEREPSGGEPLTTGGADVAGD